MTPTAINFVHVNGRSLYINWRIVVMLGGGCPTPCKKGGRIFRAGKMSGEHVMSRENVQIPLRHVWFTIVLVTRGEVESAVMTRSSRLPGWCWRPMCVGWWTCWTRLYRERTFSVCGSILLSSAPGALKSPHTINVLFDKISYNRFIRHMAANGWIRRIKNKYESNKRSK